MCDIFFCSRDIQVFLLCKFVTDDVTGCASTGLPVLRCMRGLVYMASRDKVDVDTFHKGIQYALGKIGTSKFGFQRTAVLIKF